jgi:hypothetical protein
MFKGGKVRENFQPLIATHHFPVATQNLRASGAYLRKKI